MKKWDNRDTLALTVCVNKTQIKISLSLYPFQITSWSGWIVARMTSTLSWSHCQNPEVELVPWQIQILIGQNDLWPLTSWLLTLQWPCDKDYQHDVQQTSCLKKIHTGHTRQDWATPDYSRSVIRTLYVKKYFILNIYYSRAFQPLHVK